MAEPPGSADTGRNAGLGSDPEPAKRKQSWGQVLLIVALGLGLLLVVVAHLTGAIGPGLHGPAVTPSPSSSVTESPLPFNGGR